MADIKDRLEELLKLDMRDVYFEYGIHPTADQIIRDCSEEPVNEFVKIAGTDTILVGKYDSPEYSSLGETPGPGEDYTHSTLYAAHLPNITRWGLFLEERKGKMSQTEAKYIEEGVETTGPYGLPLSLPFVFHKKMFP